jgi:hypothetical protein
VTDYKKRFDIFLCGGSEHLAMLGPLLRKLQPYGTVHLGSSFLSDDDLHVLDGLYDVLHTPRHSEDGYHNFELFSIHDINRIATAPYFVKLDADIHLEADWIDYVEECIAEQPDAVLFGPRKGNVDISYSIEGEAVRALLQQEIRVSGGRKVIGGFYVGQTAFFKQHLRLMDLVHGFLSQRETDGVRVTGPRSAAFRGNEDTLRSLVVHAAGAGDRLHVFDARGRIRIERTNTVNP